jgi:CheY-like chemotaxis protein
MNRPNHNSRRSVAILLIDDDPDCRGLFRDALAVGRIDCTLYEKASAPEALGFLRRTGFSASAPRPALIFTDIEMPGPSGLDVLAAIKSDPRLRDIPVIVLSGVKDAKPMAIAARNGAADYIVKPVDPAAYVSLVARATRYWLARVTSRKLAGPV